LVKQLNRPWIACNRSAEEGGKWEGDEARRIDELVKAIELGADIVDIELNTRNLEAAIPVIKKRAKCLLSFHELEKTPSLDRMKGIVQKELEAGADICKVITTAQRLEDNLTVLQLIAKFPKTKIVSFAMGPLGLASRILCPLVGSDFTYASIEEGKESAPGQITARELRKLYNAIK
jgi:3-dehydroquinate dehydratase type I